MGAYKGTQHNTLQGGANTHVLATDSNVDYVTGDIALNEAIKGSHNNVMISSTNITKDVTDTMNNAVNKGIDLAGSVVNTLADVTGKILNANSEKDEMFGDLIDDTFAQMDENHSDTLGVITEAMGKVSAVYNDTQDKLLNNQETRRIDVNGLIKSALILTGAGVIIFGIKAVKNG